MNRSHLNRIKRIDQAARWVITLGGIFIIACVVAIIFMIAKVALPLFYPATARPIATHTISLPAASESALLIGSDDYLENGFVLDRRGVFNLFGLRDGQPGPARAIAPPTPQAHAVVRAERIGPNRFSLLWDDGSLLLAHVNFTPAFSKEGRRTIDCAAEVTATLPPPAPGQPAPQRSLVRQPGEGELTRVDLLPGDHLTVLRQTSKENLLGEKTSEDLRGAITDELPGPLTALTLSHDGQMLYAATGNGWLLRWSLADPEKPALLDKLQAFTDARPVTALDLVLGDVSLVVGDGRGGLSTWFAVAGASRSGVGTLTRIHELTPHAAAITQILPSPRDKSILSVDARGAIALDHMTSERHLLELHPPGPLTALCLTGRGNGLVGLAGRTVTAWAIDNPHPEVSWKTLFGKVWYEHYPRPDYAWQSSAANDDFEPKLSLTPLIYGTFKATFYALLLAVPLAILGALYTSQFMRPGLRRFVKPAVEVMAAIPSVVLGFLAALWLAPRVESSTVGVFISFLFVPLMVFLVLLFWQRLEAAPLVRKLAHGHEFLLLTPIVIAGTALALNLGPLIEHHLFGGAFNQWVYNNTGIRYDQRNSIIIAFGLGIAVIPIVFTIADDALTNIPRSLTAASLALGASRWQTAWRVVLPSASPGIFAGVMIGLGRAVGETMIVLMATGNTALMSFSPFNGMRTLSANIAVETPEAPVAGTLYRVLFLTAVLLFLLTFVLNTVAELVRQRLRKKYGSL